MPQNPIRTQAIPPASSSLNIAALTAGTQIKTGPGTLVSLNVNTVGTVTPAITFYDGTSTAGKKLGSFSTLAIGQTLIGMSFVTGLFAVVTGTTSGDLTVGYR